MSWTRTPPRIKVYEGANPSAPRQAPVRIASGLSVACVPILKGPKAKPGKRTPTKVESEWMDAIVKFGCIACYLDGKPTRPTAVHHMLRGGVRIGHLFSLPLCDPGHHQGGAQFGLISRHPWKARFEKRYGTELELLGNLKVRLGFFDKWEAA